MSKDSKQGEGGNLGFQMDVGRPARAKYLEGFGHCTGSVIPPPGPGVPVSVFECGDHPSCPQRSDFPFLRLPSSHASMRLDKKT